MFIQAGYRAQSFGCEFEASSQRELHLHFRDVHQYRLWKCNHPDCDFTSTRRKTVYSHNRLRHTRVNVLPPQPAEEEEEEEDPTDFQGTETEDELPPQQAHPTEEGPAENPDLPAEPEEPDEPEP